MESYFKIKKVNAKPIKFGEYAILTNTPLLSGDPFREGYLVEHIGMGNPNTTIYNNYVSWLSKEYFELEYSKITI